MSQLRTARRLLAALTFTACLLPVGAHAASAATAPCTRTELEGCYTYAQSRQIFDYSVQWVREAAATVAPGTAPRSIRYLPHGSAVASACPPSKTGNAAVYCHRDGTVYLGQDFLWEYFRDAGDAGPAVVLAHEWGHRIQQRAGILNRPGLSQVAVEVQADCVAGAFARQLRATGRFSADDVDDLNVALVKGASDPTERQRTHGTVEERILAAHAGLNAGLKACNAYVPGSTLK